MKSSPAVRHQRPQSGETVTASVYEALDVILFLRSQAKVLEQAEDVATVLDIMRATAAALDIGADELEAKGC